MQKPRKNTRSVVVPSAALLLLAGSQAYADLNGQTEDHEPTPILDEFFFTETVHPQEKGEFQFTTRALATKDDDEGDTEAISIGIEYGITDSLQVEAEWVAWNRVEGVEDDEDDHDGSGDMEVGVKYAFEENQENGVRVAIGFDVTIPLGDVDKDLGEGFWVYEPYVVVSKDFGEDTNLTFNLSYGFLDRDEYPDERDEAEPEADEIEVGLGLVHAFAPAWRGTLELNLESNEQTSKGEETVSYLTPGFVYKGYEDVEVGLGVPVGLTDDSADWGVIGMLSLEF